MFHHIFLINIYKTALNTAVEKGNIEIVKLLLNCQGINPEIESVQFLLFNLITHKIHLLYFQSFFSLISFHITLTNEIQNKLFQWNLNMLNFLMKFQKQILFK